jgi:hypothetical protein
MRPPLRPVLMPFPFGVPRLSIAGALGLSVDRFGGRFSQLAAPAAHGLPAPPSRGGFAAGLLWSLRHGCISTA